MNRLHKRMAELSAGALFALMAACTTTNAQQPTIAPSPTTQPTATVQATSTPTNTPQPTYKPTVTPSPTPSPTATPTPSPTATPSPSPTATATASPTPTATPDLRADLEMTLGQYERTHYIDGVARYSIPYSIANRGDADAANSTLQVRIEGREYNLNLPAIAKGQTIDDVLEMQLNPGEHKFTVSVAAEREAKIDQKNEASLHIFERGQVTVLKEVMDLYQRVIEEGFDGVTVGWEHTMGSPSNPFRIYIAGPQDGDLAVSAEAKQHFMELIEQWPKDLMNYKLVDSREESNVLFLSYEHAATSLYGNAAINPEPDSGMLASTWFGYNRNADFASSHVIKGLRATLRGAINGELFSAITGLGDRGVLNSSYVGRTTLASFGARSPDLTTLDMAFARIHRRMGPGRNIDYIQTLIDNGDIVVFDPADPTDAALAQQMIDQGIYSTVNPGNPEIENSPIMGTTPVAQALFHKFNLEDYNVWKEQQPTEIEHSL